MIMLLIIIFNSPTYLAEQVLFKLENKSKKVTTEVIKLNVRSLQRFVSLS